MKRLSLCQRVSLGACLMGLSMAAVCSEQSSANTSPASAASEAAPRAQASGGVASTPSKPTAAKRAVLPSHNSGATDAPRPKMGLKLVMTQPKGHANAKGAIKPSRYQNTRGTEKAQQYYAGVWGVDKLKASSTNSGNLIKFSYRVLQPKRAAALGEHESSPELIGIRSNVVLHVPTMEKIGQLRQMSAAEADKDYWMVFSNKGNLVKSGDEVSVIIGKFRADGLIVE